jgi:hypothetical protein
MAKATDIKILTDICTAFSNRLERGRQHRTTAVSSL